MIAKVVGSLDAFVRAYSEVKEPECGTCVVSTNKKYPYKQ